MNQETQVVPIETLLELVGDSRRRRVLRHLAAADDAVTVAELAGAVADDGASEPPGVIPDRSRVATELHHVHLPKLAGSGVIEYDPQDGVVRYRSHAQLEELLEFVADLE